MDENFNSVLGSKLYHIIEEENVKILSCKSRRQKAVGLYESHASSMPTVNTDHYFVAPVSVWHISKSSLNMNISRR
jgi:hypothetical protein